ncbi:nucleolar and spindle-associated protein 1 [Thalassophryne amazonica]|uniref:nucleolar and spindle-associated protein 1 n=1 Tax=Thalassophryne amazonica TaxID=390379 RepID=UPI0014725067|nr:nucleolar and spindle-associated protein 1 [Thalassophryne amazonica]
MDLESMKYAELRALAKELGVKANMKADKLLKAIKQHYQEKKADGVQNDDAAEGNSASHDDAQKHEDAAGKEVHDTDVFVNTRRGKQKGIKRKMSETSAVMPCDAELPDGAAAARGDTAAASCRKGSKKEIELPEESSVSEQQPDIKHDELAWGGAGDEPKGGKIPRYGRLQKTTALKPVTPNFKKLHEAHFNKMESIDSYVQRKTKQMETYRNAVKELKVLSDKTKPQAEIPPANQSRASMFSPAPVNKTGATAKRRKTMLSTSKLPVKKPGGKEDDLFRPSVISTRRINVRFSEATNDEYKQSLVKTPARMSLCVASNTPQKLTSTGGKAQTANTSTLSATKTPGPFIFTANSSTSATPGIQKKPSFDLKASLSRPLSYKPHTGKLRPFGEMKVNTAGNGSVISHSQQNYKQPQVQTREKKRAKHIEERKQKKESMLGARRGLVMM